MGRTACRGCDSCATVFTLAMSPPTRKRYQTRLPCRLSDYARSGPRAGPRWVGWALLVLCSLRALARQRLGATHLQHHTPAGERVNARFASTSKTNSSHMTLPSLREQYAPAMVTNARNTAAWLSTNPPIEEAVLVP